MKEILFLTLASLCSFLFFFIFIHIAKIKIKNKKENRLKESDTSWTNREAKGLEKDIEKILKNTSLDDVEKIKEIMVLIRYWDTSDLFDSVQMHSYTIKGFSYLESCTLKVRGREQKMKNLEDFKDFKEKEE